MNTFIKGLVSIAIPAYKATYLKEAIESVLSQTYTNFELIIVNDKSPEYLDSIVLSFKDSRIRYYKNKINLGKKSIVHNWNMCLSYAKGEFFVLLCDDDIMKHNFIEIMLKYAKKYPLCNVFKTRSLIIDNNINNIVKETPIWDEFQNEMQFIENKFKGLRNHTISEFFYRTNYIKRIQYIPYPAGYYSDDASIIQFIKEGGIVSTSETLMIFRMSLEQITGNSKYNIQKVKAALLFYKWLQDRYKIEVNKYSSHIYNRIDYELYTYFIKTRRLFKAIYILYLIPNNLWGIRKKTKCFINWIH